jgi:uncharacterized membrane protein
MNYHEIQPNRELRAYARQQLKGVWGNMAFTFFILFLIFLPYYIFSYLNSGLNAEENNLFFNPMDIYLLDLLDKYMPDIVPIVPPIANLLTIAVLLAVGPFALGFVGFFLKRIRGETIAVENIFDGFKRFFPAFLTMFFTVLFTFLWSLLLIIPGIIKAFGYSMAFYIMYDNPEIKPLEALKKSQILMKGYKMKLFLLELSFIGWTFLAILPFMLAVRWLNNSFAALPFILGILWLYPYIYLSIANFYENLKRNQEKDQAVNQAVNTEKPPVDFFQAT